MVSCEIIGDSIAAGIAMYKHNCEVHAQVGINSATWNRRWLVNNIAADHVIISLGSNDWDTTETRRALFVLRSHITAARVTWLIPAIKPDIRDVIERIALHNGDGMIDLIAFPRGTDHVHPTGAGYALIASELT